MLDCIRMYRNSRGIRSRIAISMAKEGAVVIVNYNGSAAKAEDVVKEITEAGGQAEAVQCNVSDYSAAEVFLKDIISRYKRIDILVNNAGITRDNLLMKMSYEEGVSKSFQDRINRYKMNEVQGKFSSGDR